MSLTLSLIDFKVLRGGGQVGIIVDRLLSDLQVVTRNRILYFHSSSLVFTGLGHSLMFKSLSKSFRS